MDTTVLSQGKKPSCENCTDANGVGQIGILLGYKNAPDAKKQLQVAAKKKLSPEEQEKRLKKQINRTHGPMKEKAKQHTIPAELTDCGVENCESQEFNMLNAPDSDIKRKQKNLKAIDDSLFDLEIDG